MRLQISYVPRGWNCFGRKYIQNEALAKQINNVIIRPYDTLHVKEILTYRYTKFDVCLVICVFIEDTKQVLSLPH